MKGLLFVALIALLGVSSSTATPYRTADFSYYWPLDEINEYLVQLGERFPEITEIEQMGLTEEGRLIHGIRIVNNTILEERNYTMPIILITAGASARDWISVMAAVNIIHELVEHYHEFSAIVDYLEWFVVPVLNPDGYAFSHTPGNRDWVKNRRPNAGSDCLGVNLERNFDVYWDTEINSSTDPCSDNFRGGSINSEEETRLISWFLMVTARLQESYVSIQSGIQGSFGGFIGLPFGHSNEAIPDNWERKQTVGEDMGNRVHRVTGARYRAGNVANIAGPASGTSLDYATLVTETPLSFTIFTPPGSTNAWDVPEWRINAIVDQVFAAVDDMARHLIFSPGYDD